MKISDSIKNCIHIASSLIIASGSLFILIWDRSNHSMVDSPTKEDEKIAVFVISISLLGYYVLLPVILLAMGSVKNQYKWPVFEFILLVSGVLFFVLFFDEVDDLTKVVVVFTFASVSYVKSMSKIFTFLGKRLWIPVISNSFIVVLSGSVIFVMSYFIVYIE